VTLTGSSQIALARLGRKGTAVARADIDDSHADTSAGQPVMLTPRQAPSQYSQNQYYQSQYPQGQYAQRPDDGYIYPADGSDTGARYPAPRSARRLYDAQAYSQQRPYYNNPQYASPPPAYQPRPYYQSRGFFD